MELRSAIETRRMVRSFSGAPVRPEIVDGLLDLAVRAPSAGNAAGREFVVLEGAETARYWDATTTAAGGRRLADGPACHGLRWSS